MKLTGKRTGYLVHSGLAVLTVAMGMQVLRALLPLLVFVLRDRVGWSATHLGLYAVVLFSASFLAAPLWRLLGVRRLLLVSAAAVGVLRLSMQVWWGDPLVLLGLATAGTLGFIVYLPTHLVAERPAGPVATGRFGMAILLGFAADTALHGALFTWDLVWQRQAWAVVVTGVLVGAQLVLVALYQRHGRQDAPAGGTPAASPATPSTAGAVSAPWLVVGPALALTLLVFDNVARAAAVGGLRSAWAFAVVMAAQAAGVAAASLAVTPQGLVTARRSPVAQAASLGLLLGIATAMTPSGGLLTATTLIVGQAALGVLLVSALHGLGVPPRHPAQGASGGGSGPGRLSAVGGAGMLLFVMVLFLTYAGYDIALPLPAAVLGPLAAAVMALSTIPALRAAARAGARPDSPPGRPAAPSPPRTQASRAQADRWLPAAAAAALLAVPAVVLAVDRPAETRPPGDTPRIMTYNIHNGFDTDGRLDLEAIARTIEEQDPDVVALQEVARGWVVDGSADTLAWLSRRLDMGASVYGATSGPLWGNAILSRVPLDGAETHPLPTDDLLLRRGFIRALVGGADGTEPIAVFATHYHHVEDGSPIRVQQSQTLLESWRGGPRTIIMGDLNGEPGSPEIEMLRDAGLVEAVAAAGISPGYTYASDDPYQRIDYIWLTPDLLGAEGAPRNVVITTGTASDHLGIATTIGP